MAQRRPRVIVVGAGVSGLTAAHDLAPTCDVVVLEAADRVGGKLRRDEVAGVTVDVGAEAMLARRPEGVALAAELGLDVVHPTAAASQVWTRGALRPLPRTLLGVPLDGEGLAASGILGPEGLERALHPRVVSEPEGDVSVGHWVEARYGAEVVDRLVEPLLGGVYAGRAREISLAAAVPQLRALERLPAPTPGPVFAGLAGGMAGLTDRLARDLDVRTGVTVRDLSRTDSGFRLVSGPTTRPEAHEADAVVVAAPAAASSRLLEGTAPIAARELGEVPTASVVVVTLAFRADDVPAAAQDASGFLVPPVDGRGIKASTFSFAKWAWVREAGDGLLLLRTSLGRAGEEQTLQRPDEELVAVSRLDLAEAVGITAAPVDTHVQRWGGGLPQYLVGHLDRVDRIDTAVAAVPGLAVCGAAYRGVGIPACIASGRAAAAAILAGLAYRPDPAPR